MASFTFGFGHPFPAGTTVSCYPDVGQKPNKEPSVVAAVTTAAVQSNGMLTFTGLTAGVKYYAVALLSGKWTWVAFRTAGEPELPASGDLPSGDDVLAVYSALAARLDVLEAGGGDPGAAALTVIDSNPPLRFYRHYTTIPADTPTLATSAARDDWITLQGEWRSTDYAAIRAANPNCKILLYKNLTRLADAVGPDRSTCVLKSVGAANGWNSAVVDSDVTANGVIWNGTDVAGYAAACLAGIDEQIARFPLLEWDGMFMDDMNRLSDGADPLGDAHWRTQMTELNRIVCDGLRDRGLLSFANMSGCAGESNFLTAGWVGEQFDHYDGGVDEFFITFPGGTFTAQAHMDNVCRLVRSAQERGKWYIGMVPSDSEAVHTFAAAVLLVFSRGLVGLHAHPVALSFAREDWYVNLHDRSKLLGRPVGEAFLTAEARWQREFELGLVEVDMDCQIGIITIDEQAGKFLSQREGRFTGGRWYVPQSSTGTAAWPVNQVGATPHVFAKKTTLAQLAMEVTGAAAAGGLGRCVIWDDAGGYPGNVVFDSGTFATDSAAVKTADPADVIVPPGLYWIGFIATVQSPTIRTSTSARSSVGAITAANAVQTLPAGFSISAPGGVYNPFPVSAEIAAAVPRVAFRVA